MANVSELRGGTAIIYKNNPWVVVSSQFVNPGKGAAFARVKLKNLKTDQVVENTFKSTENIELADVVRKKAQFLYHDASNYNFMDNETYEQYSLSSEAIGDAKKFLLDGTDCYVLHIEGKPVSIQLPAKMDFKVIKTTPGVKGDTATGGSKECTIETGTIIKVPLFIKEGETIKINTEDGSYVSKA